jgi:hypothetical protein
MDHIDNHLRTASLDANYDPAIQAALAVGKKLLNKYYSLTDNSELYRIAMGTFSNIIIHFFYFIFIFLFEVLHPSHKLEYFKAASWDDEWIETAEELVRSEFERTYANIEAEDWEAEDATTTVSLYLFLLYLFNIFVAFAACDI